MAIIPLEKSYYFIFKAIVQPPCPAPDPTLAGVFNRDYNQGIDAFFVEISSLGFVDVVAASCAENISSLK